MRFVCKSCGMITDNPEIVPHPDKDKNFREIQKIADDYVSKGKRVPGVYQVEDLKYNYSITCPVCENETRFWREEPFPTDEPPEMKQERCDDEHCFLPKGHEGLHQAAAIITDKEDNINLSTIPTRVV